ncbi:hypothetical protein VN21_11345 [Paraclostridium benzoelyticum]|uniref:Uncharacterized protein n=1 Tax=Paraclostridium benzoelyticum TaxID=1629550 RepID=A0A0M3DHW8_9FIRM|nr:hypothetical protein [Paraclostridium benzoelyticum]KKY00962.1 hypothetical protein VN21_11345 [Paraclostridium benzoelyticum]
MDERILNEKKKYDKMYTDLVFAANDLKQMLSSEELRKRVFIRKLDDLSGYIAFLNDLEKEEKNEDKNIFSKLFKKKNNIEDEIQSYLTRDKRESINKLDKCKTCKCINCVKECNFNRCINCRESEYTYDCDKEKFVFTKSTDIVTLYNGDEEFKFDVKGYLIEIQDQSLSRYVYLVDSKDKDNQQLLEYFKFKGEESYDSVIDGEDTSNLDRLYNKFIEMGLNV